MTFSVPKDHPRYASLLARDLLEQGVNAGITTLTGLVAHGRGEAFDYLLGEQSGEFSRQACRAAAATLLGSRKSVISINGNSAMLVPAEMISLARAAGAFLEINIFHDTGDRRKRIAERFRSLGADVLGEAPDAFIPGLSSHRARVDSRGMLDADVVLVSIEDGDRTEALVQGGKVVIAIDLNPLSRTPQMSQIPIIDNVQRAFPLLEQYYRELRTATPGTANSWLEQFDRRAALRAAELQIRRGTSA